MSRDVLVSVVVCTHSRARLAGECVDSILYQLTRFEFEVIVIDDGSTDNTAEKMREKASQFPHRLLFHTIPKGGVNVARNFGLGVARGQIILYIDDDELVPPGHLQRIADKLSAQPEIDGIGGPCREYKRGAGPRTCEGCSLADADIAGEGVRRARRLLGGNMALRKEAFDSVGAFCDALSGRGDDDEWFFRAAALGKRFQQDPELWVWHRKDHLTLLSLCLHGFKQGLSVPRAQRLKGDDYRPRPRKFVRALGHAALRGCSKGLWDASREFGSLMAYLFGSRKSGQPH